MIGERRSVSLKLPFLPKRFASPLPYFGALLEIQILDLDSPDIFIPPPHGVGSSPYLGTLQNARYIPTFGSKPLPVTVIVEFALMTVLDTESSCPLTP